MGDRERSGVYSAEAVLGRLVEKDKPVSYTHLDVYKRQGNRRV